MNILEKMAKEELAEVEARAEQTWNLAEFERDFSLVGYCEPVIVVVRRRLDGQLRTLWYTTRPRTYFGFQASIPAEA